MNNEIIPNNALQPDNTIYVDEMPGKVKSAQLTIEPLYDEWFEGRHIRQPNGLFVLSGTLVVVFDQMCYGAIVSKINANEPVNVRLRSASAQFFAMSAEAEFFGQKGRVTVTLTAQQTEYVPIQEDIPVLPA